ncbi:Ubiquitin carboxyl-terminal hydrolase 32, partial [Ophiophagus hannah]
MRVAGQTKRMCMPNSTCVFDVDRDGVLSKIELEEMVVALLEVWKDNRIDNIPELHMNLPDIVEDILKSHDTTKARNALRVDTLNWTTVRLSQAAELTREKSVYCERSRRG